VSKGSRRTRTAKLIRELRLPGYRVEPVSVQEANAALPAESSTAISTLLGTIGIGGVLPSPPYVRVRIRRFGELSYV
jgi:hypothetical protein